ncbi:MAG TPA: DUF11 domain-containing protein, partial [Chloroflexi bacterium]|nr:DUF11 domain-containing protein [Chloroflexota bacterium]
MIKLLHRSGIRRKTVGRGLLLFIAGLIALFNILFNTPSTVQALPTGFQAYYILGNEEQIYNMFVHIDTYEYGGIISSNQMRSVVTLVATADNQIIYYDHWEDGYEADIFNPVQSTTEVYGDGDPTNGGSGSDILSVGDIVTLKSDGSGGGVNAVVPVDPRGTDVRYDGGDHVVSTGGPVDLVHAMWPQDGTWIGGAWEVYSLQAWAASFSYHVPIGVDTSSDDFKYVWLQVEALYDNTTIVIDNGSDSAAVTMDKGQTYSSMGYLDSQPSTPITVTEGTTISSDRQIQIGLITGGPGTFQTRFFVLLPDLMWSNEYIVPIPRTTDEAETELYLYNPNDHAITVQAYDADGADTLTIPARQVILHSTQAGYAPVGSAVRLESTDTFWGLAAVDTEDTPYDWGYSLIPIAHLKDEYFVSWAPGNVLDPVTSGSNASPVWVAPIADGTTFYVDYGPMDGVVDETFTLNALETRRIFDPDYDNSGMHIWASGKFITIWGADPSRNQPGDGYLDLGYTVLPLRQEWLEPVMTLEKSVDTDVLPPEGGEVTFQLEVRTHGPAPVTNVDITDTLPISWTYVPDSAIVTYADGSQGYPEPSINDRVLHWDLSHDMYSNEPLRLQFDARIQTGGSVGATRWDGFESGDYTGGSINWLGDWNASGGNDVAVVGSENGIDPYAGSYQLRLRDDNVSVSRSADLSEFVKPMLRFKRNAYSLEDGEFFYLDVYDGSTWHNGLRAWTDGSQEGTWVLEELDLSPYAASVTTIRFRSPSGGMNNDDLLYVDDVEIYDAVRVSENRGWASGRYRDHMFNATDTAVVYVSPLSLNKAADRATAVSGETIVYALTCRNSGGVTVTGVRVSDLLPWGVNFVAASNGGTYVTATNTVGWLLGEIGPSETKSVAFSVTVDADVSNGFQIENVGQVRSDQTDPVNSNRVRVEALAPDLSVNKLGPANASEGEVITYTIQYVNVGGAAASGVVISDVVPDWTTYQADSIAINTGSGWVALTDAADGDAGAYDGSAVVVRPGAVAGEVAEGESGSIRFRVQIASSVPDGTSVVNRATIEQDGREPWRTPLVATAIKDLTIRKEADRAVAVAGDAVAYTLTYGNHGSITETNVVIYDTIPAHSTYISGTAAGAGLTIEYSTDRRQTWTTTQPSDPSLVTDLRWSRSVLPVGETGQQASFQVRLDDPLAGGVTLSNYATISSAESGLIYSNILDIATVDVVIYKSAGAAYAFPGDVITYTLTYGNNGSAVAADVVISDTLPVSVTYVSGSITGSGADDSGAPTLVWRVGSLPAGASRQASYVVSLASDATPGADIPNTALLVSALDTATSNESHVTVASAGVAIGPSRQADVSPGETITYSHYIINTGNVSDTFDIAYGHSLWPLAATTLYHDQDGDGVRDASDPVIAGTTGPVLPGRAYNILLVMTIPADADAGIANETTITATSQNNPAHSSSVVDTSTIPDAPITGLDLDVESSSVEINTSVAFSASVTGGTNVVYTWDFG